MSVFGTAAAVLGGLRTAYDKVLAINDSVRDDVMGADIPTELHDGQGEMLAQALFGGESEDGTVHVFDRKAEMLADLARADALIEEAWDIIIAVMQQVP